MMQSQRYVVITGIGFQPVKSFHPSLSLTLFGPPPQKSEFGEAMRLLDTSTLKLSEFGRANIPYAILSHTWGGEESTLQDIEGAETVQKAGFEKIQKACAVARADGFRYIWIDTCGIDKSSSAELSEAINSMFIWYRKAKTCYAYLSDVDDLTDFSQSRWFTRGWTLQELLAPGDVRFYSSRWTHLGTKQELKELIGKITGIDTAFLIGADLRSASIAERMSWAARRMTTRIEDVAYSLLGIFNVNMPLLYGEGDKAFARLQEEIIRHSTDCSLFAWDPDYSPSNFPITQSILAKHPSKFCKAGDIIQQIEASAPFTMTNQGLHIQLPVFSMSKGPSGVLWAILPCQFKQDPTHFLAIPLYQVDSERFVVERLGNFTAVTVLREFWHTMEKISLFIKREVQYDNHNVRKREQLHGIGELRCLLRRMPSGPHMMGYELVGRYPDTPGDMRLKTDLGKAVSIRNVPNRKAGYGSSRSSAQAALLLFRHTDQLMPPFVVIVRTIGERRLRLSAKTCNIEVQCHIAVLEPNKSLQRMWQDYMDSTTRFTPSARFSLNDSHVAIASVQRSALDLGQVVTVDVEVFKLELFRNRVLQVLDVLYLLTLAWTLGERIKATGLEFTWSGSTRGVIQVGEGVKTRYIDLHGGELRVWPRERVPQIRLPLLALLLTSCGALLHSGGFKLIAFVSLIVVLCICPTKVEAQMKKSRDLNLISRVATVPSESGMIISD